MAEIWKWIGDNSPAIQSVAVVVSALTAFVLLRHSSKISRREATIEMVNSQLEDDGDSYNDFKNLIADSEAAGTALESFAAETADNRPGRDILLRQLNRYELVALAIKEGVFDERFYKRWYYSQFMRDFEKLTPLISGLRTHYANPAYYCEYESLAARWNHKRHPVKHPPKWRIAFWVVTGQRGKAKKALDAETGC